MKATEIWRRGHNSVSLDDLGGCEGSAETLEGSAGGESARRLAGDFLKLRSTSLDVPRRRLERFEGENQVLQSVTRFPGGGPQRNP